METALLSITLVQQDIIWQNTQENIQKLNKLFQFLDTTDILVLPEMFNVGFTMDSEQVASQASAALNWMKTTAKKHNCVVVGSIPVLDEGHYYNRLFWVESNTEIKTYDKRHLFRMANEHNHYSQGQNKLIVDYKGWKICPMICYDLRFPVWSRNAFSESRYDYDILIYIANWPEVRKKPWITLLQARAIENLSYVVGVNRVGVDGNNIPYSGNSAVYDFKGEKIVELIPSIESVETVTLNKESINVFRQKFPAGLDSDKFELLR